MSKLYLTIGLPASGKSCFARSKQIRNPNLVKIELDDLRREYGLSLKETPKELLLDRDNRVYKALREEKDVICSDTNLSNKAVRRLKSIAEQAKAEVEYIDFRDVPVEECIKRDSMREESKRVGKEVILMMYSRFRPNLPVRVQDKNFIIGDVHGDYVSLTKLLNKVGVYKTDNGWVNEQGFKIIFLGDLNDPRFSNEEVNRKEMSSWKVMCIAKELWESGDAEILHSNHHENLIRAWRGQRDKLNYGLEYTMEELNGLDHNEVDKMINFLDSLPYFHSFVSGGRSFTCVHASYVSGMSQFSPAESNKSNAIYGFKNPDGSRREWWRDEEYLQSLSTTVICGHYHEVGFFPINQPSNFPKAILLDGGSGQDSGSLWGLEVTKGKIKTHLTTYD